MLPPPKNACRLLVHNLSHSDVIFGVSLDPKAGVELDAMAVSTASTLTKRGGGGGGGPSSPLLQAMPPPGTPAVNTRLLARLAKPTFDNFTGVTDLCAAAVQSPATPPSLIYLNAPSEFSIVRPAGVQPLPGGSSHQLPVGLRLSTPVKVPLGSLTMRDTRQIAHLAPDTLVHITEVYFPVLSVIIPRWLITGSAAQPRLLTRSSSSSSSSSSSGGGSGATVEVDDHQPTLFLLSGANSFVDASFNTCLSTTEFVGCMATSFLEMCYPWLSLRHISSTVEALRYDTNVSFVKKLVIPMIDMLRRRLVMGVGDIWRKRFHVYLSLAAGSPARLAALNAAMREYAPNYLHVHEVHGFWNTGELFSLCASVHLLDFNSVEATPAVPLSEVDDNDVQLLVAEMRKHIHRFLRVTNPGPHNPLPAPALSHGLGGLNVHGPSAGRAFSITTPSRGAASMCAVNSMASALPCTSAHVPVVRSRSTSQHSHGGRRSATSDSEGGHGTPVPHSADGSQDAATSGVAGSSGDMHAAAATPPPALHPSASLMPASGLHEVAGILPSLPQAGTDMDVVDTGRVILPSPKHARMDTARSRSCSSGGSTPNASSTAPGGHATVTYFSHTLAKGGDALAPGALSSHESFIKLGTAPPATAASVPSAASAAPVAPLPRLHVPAAMGAAGGATLSVPSGSAAMPSAPTSSFKAPNGIAAPFSSIPEAPSASREPDHEIVDFWLRKTRQPVLAVLLVRKGLFGAPQFYYGLNVEVSMPTGSVCSERVAISSALAADPGMKRKDIRMVAVMSLPKMDPPDKRKQEAYEAAGLSTGNFYQSHCLACAQETAEAVAATSSAAVASAKLILDTAVAVEAAHNSAATALTVPPLSLAASPSRAVPLTSMPQARSVEALHRFPASITTFSPGPIAAMEDSLSPASSIHSHVDEQKLMPPPPPPTMPPNTAAPGATASAGRARRAAHGASAASSEAARSSSEESSGVPTHAGRKRGRQAWTNAMNPITGSASGVSDVGVVGGSLAAPASAAAGAPQASGMRSWGGQADDASPASPPHSHAHGGSGGVAHTVPQHARASASEVPSSAAYQSYLRQENLDDAAAAASNSTRSLSHSMHVPVALNPLAPCGSCTEWLRKVAEVNPDFRIVTFTDVSCERLFIKHVPM